MPSPNVNTVHIDAILTNVSVAYIQNTANFIAGQVFPSIPVDKKSNVYFKYNKDDWFRDEAQRRADGTESAGSGYALNEDNYICDVFAFHKDIGDQTAANADNPLNPDKEASEFITQRLLLRREVQWATDFFASGVWSNQVAGASSAGSTPGVSQFDTNQTIYWDNYTSSTPIVDIDVAKAQILRTTGYEPNTLVLGYRVFQILKSHPTLVDRYKYTQAGAIVTEDLLAKLFGLEKVLVAKAVVNSGNEGSNSQTYAFTVGNSALLCYVAPNPGLYTPSAGYTFEWTGVSQGLGVSVAVKKFRMEQLAANRVEAQIAFDNKVVAPDLGYFFYNILQYT